MVIDILFLGPEKDQLRRTAMAWTVLDVGSLILFFLLLLLIMSYLPGRYSRHDSGCWA